MNERNRIWYKSRGILIAPVYLLSFLCSYRETEHWLVFALGLVIFLIGFFLRVWSQMHLHYRLKEHKILTTTGPYVFVRNPIYIGNTLILTGTTLLSDLLWLTLIMIATCMITYSLVVRYEESHLTEKYGTPYLEYLKRIPRWFPGFMKEASSAERAQWEFLIPSIWAEAHIIMLLIPPLLKELFIYTVGI
jgi:protein-S-isoprenylcysteine O-methyltransferase Ste14